MGGSPEATLLGTARRVPAELAGLVNGRAGKAFEREDKYWADESIGFGVGCSVVPAAVAMAQARGGVRGVDLLVAVALGLDLEIRLLKVLGLGFIPNRAAANATFALGNYGAAAAAAKVAALPEAGILDALGLVHGSACGNFQGQHEGRGVSIQCGYSVRNGIASTRLAALGLGGPHGSITGKAGLYALLYPRCTIDPEEIVAGLGEEYLGERLGYKAYPCGIVAHPALDAVRSVRIDPRELTSIEIDGPASLRIMTEPIAAKRAPHTPIEAQFSIPWVVACVLKDGDLTVDHFGDKALADPDLRRIAGMVTLKLRDDVAGTTVKIRLSDGSVVTPEPVLIARGHPRNPLTTNEIAEFFLRSAERATVLASSCQQALDRLLGIADESDAGGVFALLAGSLPCGTGR